ncbi:hypothetical protein sch_21855 [Serratia plymuthica]|nr:transketolase C-terminal domain-containing protein [Serratia plymuthica]AHY09944.1 hypothetical protein sch_21855 [Serratia plymuthica]
MSSRKELANAIRALSMDAVQKANSGHPGAPMGMADIAEVLWRDYMNHNPTNPHWADRDRFVLSNGHGSMLIYSLLHLTGYDLPMSELENFRQLHSKTPGHPEYGYTPGVETTTGPLVYRGGYVLKDCAGTPEVILIATGSEVGITVEAADKLSAAGTKVRVVSMPSTDAFDKQDAAYRESVLPSSVTARVAVEAGIADYWYKYVGLNGAIVGMTTFGESAPADQLFKEFGFTVDNVVAKAQALLK